MNLQELKALAEMATPGPWKAIRSHESFDGELFDIDDDEREEYDSRPYTGIESAKKAIARSHDLFEFDKWTAEFIAAANPATILKMIALIEQMYVALDCHADIGIRAEEALTAYEEMTK